MNYEHKIEDFLIKNLENERLANLSIFELEKDNYIIFGKYNLILENSKFILKSTIFDRHIIFYDIRNAVAWCIFNNSNKYIYCKDIEDLDAKLEHINTELTLYNKFNTKKMTIDQLHVYETKITELLYKKKVITKNLQKLINTSKSWQKKRYAKAKS
jgi:hypothetical protein